MTPQGRDELRDQLLLQINAKVDKILAAQVTLRARQDTFNRELNELKPIVKETERRMAKVWMMLKPITIALSGAGTAAGGYFVKRWLKS